MFDPPVTDIISLVYQQLPEAVRQKLWMSVEADAYRLRAKAIFRDASPDGGPTGRTFECELERDFTNPLTYHIPAAFIAHLCVVV
jgi:hypothetical protein